MIEEIKAVGCHPVTSVMRYGDKCIVISRQTSIKPPQCDLLLYYGILNLTL